MLKMIRLPECPICGKAVAHLQDSEEDYSPFCSRRCKEVDLFRWCEGKYAIVEPLARPGEEDEMIAEEPIESDEFEPDN
jgi:endogenous inhibitor of DNA gyrase (YacG/DUF329 family)